MPDRDYRFSMATMPPTTRQNYLALLIVLLLLLSFCASVPFASKQLGRIDSFVPVVEAINCVTDLATAVLLYGLFSIVPARSLLILASGYLYSALIVISHALSFPGAFGPNGLFGTGIQATPWLYTFWHFGFSAAVLIYAWMRRQTDEQDTIGTSPARAAWLSVLMIVVLVCGLTWAVIGNELFLPPLLRDTVHFTPAANYVTRVTVATSTAAFMLLALRRTSVLDLWVTVATFATVVEQVIVGLFIVSRFSVGFYAGRVFSVVVSTVVLIALLSETVILYGRLARANRHLRRERASKLINVEAAVAAVTHQMKQPLTAIAARSAAARRFLARTPPDIDSAQRLQDEIIGDTSHANEVFEEVRALFKQADQRGAPFNVNDIVSEAIHFLEKELEDHGIAVRTNLAPDLPPIMGNRVQLQEVILNLAQNSIDAMGTSGNWHRVLEIDTKRHGPNKVSITVQDTGPGIAREKMAKIFDTFFTTKDKGTGLGLAISRMIVERHSGQISVRSDPQKSGARFEVTLPTKATSEDEME